MWSPRSPRGSGIRCGTPTFARPQRANRARGAEGRRRGHFGGAGHARGAAYRRRRPTWRRCWSAARAGSGAPGSASRFDELLEQTQSRWQRSGEIAHRAEPDLKSGRGGLRDVQLLNALAIAQLADVYPSPVTGVADGIARRRASGAAGRAHRTAPGVGPRPGTAAGPGRRRDRRGAAHRRPIRPGPHAQRRGPHDQLLRRRRSAHGGQCVAAPWICRVAPHRCAGPSTRVSSSTRVRWCWPATPDPNAIRG